MPDRPLHVVPSHAQMQIRWLSSEGSCVFCLAEAAEARCPTESMKETRPSSHLPISARPGAAALLSPAARGCSVLLLQPRQSP